ncbi:condensin complex subunit 3 [Leptonychotes weddellii]|uniref:Condensin complex subunit 3 n=1 Tax=Leptonychotes weddellii TaxID=9713 RepID=A0A7F8QLL0_LEPWE|nr:condensin complex subunit 3 [Leptonychotes weddellii]
MGAEKKLLPVKEAFQLAQQPHQNQAKLVVALSRTYRTMDVKTVFHEEFVHYLKYAMVVYKREPAVERVIDFAAKFVTSFHQSDTEDDEEEEDGGILNYLFTFLLKSHEANSNAVRFRVCQLINKLLGSMPENAQIDDDLFDKINEAMLIRLKDKIPNVRIQAVLALSRLQDPKDDECPVVNAYATLIENDSNPEVRRAVLSCIAPSAKTLPKIVGRTKDVKETVRKLAYQVLAEKVHMRAMSIAQRVMLLQQGLNDRSDAVKQAMQKHLLQGWLRFTEGNILELLHRLDVENSPEVAVSVLNALFSVAPLNELAEICKNNDGRKLIPVETLTPENALYWRVLCEYVKSKGDEGEEFLEQILPEPIVYAEYLLSYIQSIPVVKDEMKNDFSYIGNLMSKEFIGQQLILIIKSLDTSEEGGRKGLLAVLQEILTLPTTPVSLLSFLVERLLCIVMDDNKRTQIVTEIISEIRAPIVTVGAGDPADARKKELKMAEIKVKLIEAKEALENCINLQDFNQASELKEEIKALEDAKINLLKETEQLEIKEVHIEKNDVETLQKCLILCYELLKQMSTSAGIGATMNGIIESLILPGIVSVHPVIRNLAVLCLGCCGLQNQDFASKHFVLLLQVLQIDDVTIKISALRAIFDQLMTFGIEPFKTKKIKAVQSEDAEINTDGDQEFKEAEEETATAKNVLKLLSDFLDSELLMVLVSFLFYEKLTWKDHLKCLMKLFKIYIVVSFPLIEKSKEAYKTPLRDVKATRASKSTQQKTNRGRRKVTASARMNRRRQTVEVDSESDPEIPEPESEMKMRLPRRAKTAALEKSKLNLAEFLNEDIS